ncbi:MAG: hypothetical protein OXH00_07020 [Candidatus Poribacteria bacterium]|nr:hypothetical protein [Candidatus Poribacteria bacterium]
MKKSRQRTDRNRWVPVLAGLLFLSLIIVGIVFENRSQKSSEPRISKPTPQFKDVESQVSEPTYQPTVTSISADKLYEAYDANAIDADMTYKGRTINIYGTIKNIGTDILNQPYLVVGGSGFLDGVQCIFPKEQMSSLAKLSKNQYVRIRGEVQGKVVGNVLMKKCLLLPN